MIYSADFRYCCFALYTFLVIYILFKALKTEEVSLFRSIRAISKSHICVRCSSPFLGLISACVLFNHWTTFVLSSYVAESSEGLSQLSPPCLSWLPVAAPHSLVCSWCDQDWDLAARYLVGSKGYPTPALPSPLGLEGSNPNISVLRGSSW